VGLLEVHICQAEPVPLTLLRFMIYCYLVFCQRVSYRSQPSARKHVDAIHARRHSPTHLIKHIMVAFLFRSISQPGKPPLSHKRPPPFVRCPRRVSSRPSPLSFLVQRKSGSEGQPAELAANACFSCVLSFVLIAILLVRSTAAITP
jgi:hypothetical protein